VISQAEPQASIPAVSDKAFWARPPQDRAAVWTELRTIAPVSRQAPSNLGLAPSGNGYWAVTRHADIQQVSRAPELFCSSQGVGLSDIPAALLELNASFLVMDAPRHTALRRIVSGAFTPRQVARLDADITSEADRIIDEFVEQGGGDVVQNLSMKLPLWTISRMLGVPTDMKGDLYRAAEAQIASQDPEFAGTDKAAGAVAVEAAMTLHRLAGEMVAVRRAKPADDIWSTVVHSELDGEPLSEQLLGGIFVLFATAANDTTRNTTSHSVKAFADNPAQLAVLAGEPALVSTAVEELLRWSTPVIHFRRTATSDAELSGVKIPAGDAVVMFYESANRDESTFDEPFRFDITRSPNPHLAFGGGGAHFCLGSNLARVQLRALFSRLALRAKTIEVGEPAYLISNFVNGIKRMPVTITSR
jgi:cytochrome P450